jgi:beta-lactamase regulating signal transducer with metallopeptidase domain
MNRTIFMASGILGASSLLLMDSTIKGTALLAIAAVATLLLRRDSAATRHLVWLLAIVALLLVPALSLMLPQWRVLPSWAVAPRATSAPQPAVSEKAVTPTAPLSKPDPAEAPLESPQRATSTATERPGSLAQQPAADTADALPAPATPTVIPPPANWNWIDLLPLVWAVGFFVFLLRLLAARWLLWHSESQATVVGSSSRSVTVSDDPLITAIEGAQSQLGIRQPVTLLMHPNKTIPVVWGIFRSRLLLPEAARDWSAEQLRSVLLHELAHVKRRDAIAQLLTQIACAMHWFNPLVWVAAWRLGVERERACDDRVLASGVRPSAYAGHLLDIIEDLSPARWTQACGLAMARKSSLEGRLVAVVSKNRNRRGVSMALAAIALAIAAGIAVPIAALRAADEKPAEQPKPAAPATTKLVEVVKLDPALEAKLKWGEAVNGLRAAIAIRNAPGAAKAQELDLFVAVQNVSDAAIRLSDADVPATVSHRTLYLKLDGRIMMGLGAREPGWGDHTLQPREVAFLPMFDTTTKLNVPADPTLDKHAIGSHMAEDALKDPHQTFFAKVEIDKAPAGAWRGKLKTADTTGADAAGKPQPKDKAGQALFRAWQDHARANGNFPGGLIARLGEKVKEFVRNNSGDAGGDLYAKKMAPLVGRFDATRDWTPAEVIALFDDIAAAHSIPLETTREEIEFRTIRKGNPLPKQLADAPWGETQPSGLRLAWLLEPRAAEHRLGTPLKSRVLIHNAGKDVAVFRAWTWHQSGGHKARDANGKEIEIVSTEWTTLSRLIPYRLWAGEYMEITAAGIGVGANKNDEDWQNTRVGAWIHAKAGDEVTFTPDAVSLSEWNEQPALRGEPKWWFDLIKSELAQDLPLPADAEERKRIVYRAGLRIFGTPLAADEIEAFVNDRGPDPIDALAKRLAQRAGTKAFAGSLKSAPTKFRVLPADPDAAKKPRTAKGPGRYTLGETAALLVTRRPDGDRIVNEATIKFNPADPTKPPPSPPFPLKLPDGYETWAATWVRGTNVLWLTDKGAVRSYDFANPAQVKEAAHGELAKPTEIPKPILEALRAALDVPGAARPATEAPK